MIDPKHSTPDSVMLSNNAIAATTCVPGEQPLLLEILKRANQIAALNDPHELLQRTLALMMEITGSEVGVIYLLDENARELILKVVKGCLENSQLVGLRINSQFGAAGAAMKEGRLLVSTDLKEDRLWYPELVSADHASLGNAITLPLVLRGQPTGAVQLFNYQVIQPEILPLLADRLATDYEKIGLFEEVQNRNNTMSRLIEALQRMFTTLDREQLLRLVTEETSRLLQVDKSSIFLSNSVTGDLEYNISFHHGRRDAEPPLPSESIKDGRFDHTSDRQAAAPLPRPGSKKQQHFGFVTSNAITVPLVERLKSSSVNDGQAQERIIGGLMALNKNTGPFTSDDAQILEVIASQISSLLRIISLVEESNQLYIETIKALAAAIDAKDPYTQGHSLRVSELSVAIAMELHLNNKEVHDVLIGSLVHDIGKIGIPDQVLNKTGRLSDAEFDIMRKHPLIGKRIIGEVQTSQGAQLAIIDHHERLDGSGYPFGLKGNQISLIGKIVAVADVFDAMTSDRVYRKALDRESVKQYLRENAGRLFDIDCVEALLQIA